MDGLLMSMYDGRLWTQDLLIHNFGKVKAYISYEAENDYCIARYAITSEGKAALNGNSG